MFARRTTQTIALALVTWMFAGLTTAQTATTAPTTAATAPALTAASAPASQPEATTAPAIAADAVAPTSAPAPAEPEGEKADVRFHFAKENYRDLAAFVGRMLDKPILGDLSALNGQFSYIDARPYTKTEAMSIINQVIRTSGYTLMDSGRYLKLVPLAQLPQQSDLPILRGLDETPRRGEEEIVTAILPLQYIDAAQAVSLVARMVHSFGSLSELGKGQGIIITDTVSNIRRVQRLLATIDQGTLAKSQLKYYNLKVAPADQVAKLITDLFAGTVRTRTVFDPRTRRPVPAPADTSESVTVVADPGSNTVVVVAAPDNHKMIEELITHVDVERAEGEGGVQLVKLQNASAEPLAKILTAMAGTKTITTVDRGRTQTQQVPSARIIADPDTNRLLISAEPTVMRRLLETITAYDADVITGTGVRIIPLAVANAAQLVSVVQSTFGRRDARGGRSDLAFSVTADPRTNSLIVKGPAADIEAVAKLVADLDKKTDTQREIHVVRLKAGDANETASALKRLLTTQGPGGRGRGGEDETVRIEADRGTNSLIISAAPGDWERIQATLEQLTKETEEVAATLRIFPLAHTKAAEVAPVFQRIFDSARQQGRGPRGATPSVPVVVTYDSQSNTLIVSAAAEDLEKIDRLLKTMDVPGAVRHKILVRSYALNTASAATLARSLERLFGQTPGGRGRGRGGADSEEEPQPRFEAEQNSNQLVVAATAEQFETIEKLIQDVQTSAAESATQVKLFQLQHAQAAELAPALDRVIQAELAAAQRDKATRGGRNDVQISVDARTNTLLITAPGETMTLIEQLIPKLDQPDTIAQVTKVIALTNADPNELAGALNAALAGQPAAAGPGRGRGRIAMPSGASGLKGRELLVVPAPAARAVLLTGAEEDVAFAEKLITQIDERPSTDKPLVKTLPLTHAKADDLANVLNATVGQAGPGRGRGGADIPTRITADRNANALVVSAAAETMERIEALLKQLDVEGAQDQAPTIELVKLAHAKADEVATAVNAAQASRAPGPGPRGRTGGQDDQDIVRVTPDAASNSLLLTGRPETIAKAKELITRLDEEAKATAVVTEMVELENADPNEVATAINSALTGQATSFQGRRGGGAVSTAGLANRKVMAVPAKAARTVLLSGATEDVTFAAELIRKIDQRPPTDKPLVKTLPLTHAKADDLADVLNATIGQAGRGRGGADVPTRITADRNANALVVSAAADTMERIETLLKQLDVEGAGAGAVTTAICRLENAKADELATALNAAQAPAARGQRGQPQGEDDTVRVTADAGSNSLLLTGRPERITETTKLIKQLDETSMLLVSTTQSFPLKAAKASEVVAVLEQILLGGPGGRGGRGRRGVPAQAQQPEVRLAADDTSNTILIQAPPEQMEMAAGIIKQLDSAVIDAPETRIVKLINADAIALAEAVNLALRLNAPGGRGPGRSGATGEQTLTVVAEPHSNSVVIRGVALDVQAAADLVTQLDAQGPGVGVQVRVFKLQNADAAVIAKMFDALYRQIVRAPGRRGPGGQAVPAPTAPSIAADERTNSLIVSAGAADFATVELLLKQIDVEDEPLRPVQYIPLFYADALDIQTKIEGMFADRKPADRPTVSVDSLSNGLTIFAKDADFRQIEQLVGEWERTAEPNYVSVRVIPLNRNFPAEQLAAALKRVFQQVSSAEVEITNQLPRPARGGDGLFQPGPLRPEDAATTQPASAPAPASRPAVAGLDNDLPIEEPPVIIAVDKDANALIVSAGRAEMAQIQDLIYTLTSSETASDARIQVFAVKNADPASLVKTLDALFNPRAAPGPQANQARQRGGQPGQQPPQQPRQPAPAAPAKPSVTIAADVRTRKIVALAKPAELELIGKLIEQLDTVPEVTSDVRILPLKNTDAAEVANNLRQLFGSGATSAPVAAAGAQGRGGGRNQQLVQQMLQLRQEGGEGKTVDASVGLMVSANQMTNSVIVAAPKDAMELIVKIVEELDQEPSVAAPAVRIFKIQHAEVSEVVAAVSTVFATSSRGPSRGGRGGAGGAGAGAVVAGNEATGTVIVKARTDEFELIEKVIKELDDPASTDSTIVKVYTLQQGDARTVAQSLTVTLGRSAATGAGAAAGARRGATSGDGMLRISAETASNSLVVRGTEADHARIAELITKLDSGTAEAGFRLIALANGDASDMAAALNKIIGSWPRKNTEPRPTVAVDPAANTLMVSGTAKHIETIATMVQQLDTAPGDRVKVQVIPLVNAAASEVLKALTPFYGPRAAYAADPGDKTVTLTSDDRSNSLVVAARPAQFTTISALVAKLDLADAVGEGQRVVIRLANASAQDVAQAITQSFSPARGQRVRPEDLVVAAAEPTANVVIVSASAKNLQSVRELVQQIDQEAASGEVEQVVIPLEYASAQTVAQAITRAFTPARGQRTAPQDAVTAAPEPSANALIVSASARNIEKVRALIKQIDTESTGGSKIEFMLLEHAKAVDLANVLRAVLQQGGRGRGGAGTGIEPPTLSADAASNALIMSGKKADLDTLMAMAKQLDQAVTDSGAETHLLPLKNANAAEVAAMVTRLNRDAIQAARYAGKSQSIEPVAVSADPRTNVLVVVSSAEEFKRISVMVNQIDEMSTRANLKLIQLENADPNDVLKAIQQIYGSGANGAVTRAPRAGGAARAGAGGMDATVLTGQKALLVNASEEDWKTIEQIVKALDEAASKVKPEVLVFPLAKAPNTRVAQALTNMYRAAQRPGRDEDRVTVIALAGTNAVVVTATKEKMEEVGKLIQQLDGMEIAGEMQLRVFTLQNAAAVKVLPVLQTLIRPIQEARPNQQINVTVEPRTNSIIVSTQAPVLDEIAKIIQQIDSVPPFKAADILVIPLKNADAPSLADVLTDMLTPGTSKIQTPEAKALQEQVRLLRLTQGKEGIGPLDLTKPIKITSDPPVRGQPGSNSLIVSSTPENLSAVAEIVKVLDTLPIAAGVRVQIVHLRNSDALAVMALLKDIFTQGQTLTGRPGTPTAGKAEPESSSGQALVAGLNITADARTNALVVAGTDESVALATLLINDLDREPTTEFTEVKVFKLEHADPAQLATLIGQVFAEQPAQAPGVQGVQAYVTRLRIARDKERPVAAKVARSHPTMVVRADPNASLLVVAARQDLLAIVVELVAQMDVPGAGSLTRMRMYPLKNADATRMSQVINGLYTGPNANLIRPEDRPTITVDTRTNTLVVAASEKTFAIIDALFVKLDAELPIDLRDIRLVPLANADATALAPVLQQMMDARVQRQQSLGVGQADALKMVIIADPRSNHLIVGGSAEGFQLVADLTKQLDDAPAALSGQIQLLPLTNANAGTLSATLSNLFTQRYQAARTPDLQRQRPVILPDLRTNCLMVAANQDDSQVIKSLIAKLDAKPVNPAVQLVVIPMTHNDSGAVGPMIQRVFAARLQAMTPPGQQVAPQDVVSVDVDSLSNALVVSASKENLEMIRDLLAKVDVAPPTETGIVKMYPLAHADVTRVASMLQALVSQGLYKPGLVSAGTNTIAQAREKVSITSDIRTNVLIVSASKENFAVIDEVLRTVDVKEGWGLAGNVKLYVLRHARADAVAPTLQQMFDRKRQAEAATGGQPRSLPVVIVPDARTNALLVAASKEQVDEVDILVGKLDVADITRTFSFRVFYLQNTSAATIEPTLRQLFQRLPSAGAAAAAGITTIADPKANALIVAAGEDELTLVETLVKELDKPVGTNGGQLLRVFPLAKADATQLAQTVTQLYDATRPTGGVSGVSITADARSNSLVVSAAKADMENLSELIAKLDTSQLTDVTEIRIFTLRHADADQLATILTGALTSRPQAMTGESATRAQLLRFIGQLPDGKELMATALKRGVQITSVPRTNSLLVQAPVETMVLLARLISALDTTDPRSAEIRVFTLNNAEAVQMATVLTSLFRLQLAAGQRKSARVTLATTQPAGAASATFGSAEQDALTITVDARTNSLLVCGTRENVDLVGGVIRELDAYPAEDRQTMLYRPRNAQAADIQTALRQFLDQERQRITSTLGANAVGAAQELLAREVSIQAETTTNTLLISGSPRFFKTVASLVAELDQPLPQVLVQVLLAEVTLDNTTELGFEWQVNANPGTRSVFVGTNFGLKTDAFNFSVSAGDLSLMLRALQAQGRLEVLSRPQILAADNEQAQISIGQRVPYVTASRVTEGGTTVNTIQYQDVGIILAVTPRISPDGFVKMDVAPEISSISDATVSISENLNATIINRRSADTTVTVQDGHTVVIGGLITSKVQNIERKVPIVGDIPLLGALFKTSKAVKERTELLVILTPRILRTPTDADLLANRQIRSLRLARGIHTDSSIGELLNPLGDVTPLEIKRLEADADRAARGAGQIDPIAVPGLDPPAPRDGNRIDSPKDGTAP